MPQQAPKVNFLNQPVSMASGTKSTCTQNSNVNILSAQKIQEKFNPNPINQDLQMNDQILHDESASIDDDDDSSMELAENH